jgi:hypothetical protein
MFFELFENHIARVVGFDIKDAKKITTLRVTANASRSWLSTAERLNNIIKECSSSFVFDIQGTKASFILNNVIDNGKTYVLDLRFDKYYDIPIWLVEENMDYLKFYEEFSNDIQKRIINDEDLKKVDIQITSKFLCFYAEKDVSELDIPNNYTVREKTDFTFFNY